MPSTLVQNKFENTKAKSILELLVAPRLPQQLFAIPRFQRNYSWTTKKWTDLWNDLYDNYTNTQQNLPSNSQATSSILGSSSTPSDPNNQIDLTKSQYLLGPVVLLQTDERNEQEKRIVWTVIDGQQRLATLTILFCVIRDMILDLDPPGSTTSNTLPKGLETLLNLTEQRYKNKTYGWKLRLNLTDQEFFEERIQHYFDYVDQTLHIITPDERMEKWKTDLKDPTKKDSFKVSHKRLMAAYEFFYNKINDALLTNFDSRGRQEANIESMTNGIKNTVQQKVINQPIDYDLKNDFFQSTTQIKWDGNEFGAIIPSTTEDIQKAEEELTKNNSRKSGKKFSDVKAYREYLAGVQQKKFVKKIEVVCTAELPKSQRTISVQNLGSVPEFIEAIINDNFVIHVPVTDEADAFQIFETLNARGEPLSKSELIKNMCLRRIPDDTIAKRLNEKWNKIFDDIVGESQDDDAFIRESLRSRYFDEHKLEGSSKTVAASKANLFRIIKEMNTTPDQIKRYIQDLEDDANFIKTLNDPKKLASEIDVRIKDSLIAIQKLKAGHIRLPIITAYRRWKNSDDFIEFLEFIVKFHFRNRTIEQVGPGTIEEWTMHTAKMIDEYADTQRNTRKNTLATIINYLREKDVDDETFAFKFRRYEIGSHDFAKYILLAIEEHLNSGRKSDMRPIDNITLEHILPEHPLEVSGEWDQNDFFDGWVMNPSGNKQKKFESFMYDIGNLTLLTGPDNSGASNYGFTKKKVDVYTSEAIKSNLIKKTVLNMTEILDPNDITAIPELANDLKRWTAKIIEKRTDKFTEMALQIWDLSV